MPKYRRISKKASRRLSRDFHNSVVFRLTQWRITLATGFNAFGVTMVQAADALKVAFATMLKSNTVDREETGIAPEAIQDAKTEPFTIVMHPDQWEKIIESIDPAQVDRELTLIRSTPLDTVILENMEALEKHLLEDGMNPTEPEWPLDGQWSSMPPFDHYDLNIKPSTHEGRDL